MGGDTCLSLVTCGPQLEVALNAAANRLTSLVRLGGVAPRSTLVLAAADLLIEDAGLAPDAVSTIVVSRGPGSFTGIRAGLATAAGLAAATGAQCLAYDSLLMLAARCGGSGTVWSAQPGRRGEVYARSYEIVRERAPRATGEIEIVAVDQRCRTRALGRGRGPRSRWRRTRRHCSELGRGAPLSDGVGCHGGSPRAALRRGPTYPPTRPRLLRWSIASRFVHRSLVTRGRWPRPSSSCFSDPWPPQFFVSEILADGRFNRLLVDPAGRMVAYLFCAWQYLDLHVLKVATMPPFRATRPGASADGAGGRPRQWRWVASR